MSYFRYPFSCGQRSCTSAVGVITAGMVLFLPGQRAMAQWTRTATLTNTTSQAESHFGAAVAVGSMGVAVGMPDVDVYGGSIDQGLVQAYKKSAGVWIKDYTKSDIHIESLAALGHAIDFDGTILIYSAPGLDDDAGAAYLRLSSTSSKTITAPASDRDDDDDFGRSVSMDGGIAVVGAPGDDERATNAGAVYVFESPYTSSTKIKTGSTDGAFGTAVAIDGDRIAASAPYLSTDLDTVGLVRIYERTSSGWAVAATLNNPDGSVFDFGRTIDISGEIVVVGSPSGGSYGKAFIYDLSVSLTTPIAELESPDRSSGDSFGYSVAVDGDWVIIGAPGYDHRGPRRTYTDSGAAYLYENSGGKWTYEQRLGPQYIANNVRFGSAVDIGGSVASVGAPDWKTNDAGGAYIFEMP